MREPTTHDYTRREWGHDYTFRPINGGMKARMQGWGHGIHKGDYLILEGADPGTTTRYRVDAVSYYADPKDMWSIEASFAPRDPSKD